ncbi:uncharacterized protein AruCF_1840 [Achromobacter ruhlandii]|nr:uncharacterized protein AruCF_1840 [Achromobacter ruhlandii]
MIVAPHLSLYLRASPGRGGAGSPSVGARRLSPDCLDRAVLLPESFRGGCSVGARHGGGTLLRGFESTHRE